MRIVPIPVLWNLSPFLDDMDRPVSGTVGDNLENLEIMLDRPEQAATATFDQALPTRPHRGLILLLFDEKIG